MADPILYFCSRSIRRSSQADFSARLSRVITILRSRPMVGHWLSTGAHRESRQSIPYRFRKERNNISSRVFNSDGVWPGRPTDATLFSPRLAGSPMLVGFGRYPVVEVNRNDCSLARKESNPRFKGTDWCTRARRRISTSGGGNSIHWFRPVLPIDSYFPRNRKRSPVLA